MGFESEPLCIVHVTGKDYLTDKMLFLGSRSDVPALMQAMDVFVFPSHYEGLGLVAIEAQAAGLKTTASEAITQEAQVTDLLTYCRLAQPPAAWAQRVVNAYANKEGKRPKTKESYKKPVTTWSRQLMSWRNGKRG